MPAAAANLGEVIDCRARPLAPWLIEVDESGAERAIGFAEFLRTTAALARGLGARGLARQARVGILSQNSAEYLLAYYGILRAGLCAVPINHKLPEETLEHIAADARLALLLADGSQAGRIAGVPEIRLDGADWQALQSPGEFEATRMAPHEFATILYTSGSSGRPKGVPLTHGGYLWAVEVLNRHGPPVAGKKMLVAAPLFHMNGLLQSMLTGTLAGTVVLMRRFEARQYLETIARHRCEVVTSVPTMLWLAARETETLARLDLSCVEIVTVGSAPSTEALFERIARMFPRAAVLNNWGTTESSPIAFGRHPRGLPRPPLSIGYPMAEAELRLADGPGADEGVLQVRSRAVMPGYLNLPAETAERLRDGWYDTGDVMRRDAQGFYYFVGRADDMIVCGGEKLHPGAVEKMLERHPDVLQAVVVPIADPAKHQVPVAFVVPRPGAAPTPDAIRAFALANGPAYQHPRFVELLEELPLSGPRKIDRRALAERAARAFRRD